MKAACLTAGGLMLALAGCLDPDQTGVPVTLSYPYATDDGFLPDGHKRVAKLVAGAYVRVLIYDRIDNG